jgi:DNA-binding IclR family transcriptional regulator
MMTEARPQKKQGSIAVLQKTFDLLELLQAEEEAKSLDELVTTSGLAKSTTHRLLANLIRRGYVEKNAAGRYSLGLKLLALGAAVRQRQNLRDLARPIMERLRDSLGETVNLGKIEGETVLYLETVESQQSIRVIGSLGIVDPVHATSIGKAILASLPLNERPAIRHWKRLTAFTISGAQAFTAELEKVKAQGYAVDDEESMEGGRCIGVPILKDGRPVAGLSISGPSSRIRKDRIREIAMVLKEASKEISDRIPLSQQ